MAQTRFAPLGVLAIAAACLLSTSSSDPADPTSAPTGSKADASVVDRPLVTLEGPLDTAFERAEADLMLATSPVISATERPATYLEGERLVRLTDPMDLPDLAARHGLDVIRPAGVSGYAVVGGEPTALAALSRDPAVSSVLPHATIHGAGKKVDAEQNLRIGDGADEHLQWHVSKVDPPLAESPPTDIVVAVLDTGVAYETATRGGVSYIQAPTLASSPIVSPYDFVNDDAHANDDHQHGTHIASILSSNGAIKGMAPGVPLMPIKVLDETNSGTEYGLVEGIWWAVQNNADIINMSLSFGPGYQPSRALQEALQAASDAGILMVAATGNDGLTQVSWPAASPLVMSVAGTRLGSNGGGSNNPEVFSFQWMANYSNLSAAVDMVAPGGDLSRDADQSGLVDGIVGEAISPSDPTDVGYWMMVGTSQAAAQVSGLAVELLRAGISAADTETLLKYKAEEGVPAKGFGSGFADLDWSVPDARPVAEDYYAAVLPFVGGSATEVYPRAKVTVFHADGTRAVGVQALGSIWGEGGTIVSCVTDTAGSCFFEGTAVPRFGPDGTESKLGWSVAVESVAVSMTISETETTNVTVRPKAAMTHTPAFDEVVSALQADPSTANAILAWSWSEGLDANFGPLVSSFSITDSGSGLASIPLGLTMTAPQIDDLGDGQNAMLGVSGEEVPILLFTLDGSGLKSIPLGFNPDPTLDDEETTYVFVDGSGLKSIPLGFQPDDAYGDGDLAPLDDPAAVQGTALGGVLESGGWAVEDYGGATVLSSSSLLGIQPEQTPVAQQIDGVSLGATKLIVTD